VLGGDEPGEGHEGRSTGEATEVADLGDDAHRGERLDPAQAPELGNGLSERRQLCGGLDLGGDGGELAPSHVERGEVVAIGGVGGGFLEALGACPEVELVAPALVPARIAPALAQQEALHPVLGLAAVVLDVLADAHEVTKRLLGGGGHADRVNSPARWRRARLRASIRSVFTRAPDRRGIIVGASTSHDTPSELSNRWVS